jgi:outer membrane protein TolC
VASARAAFDPTLSASVNQSWSRTRTIGNPAARSDAEVQRGEVAVAQSLTTGTRYAITAEHARSQTNTATTTGSPAHVADISLSVTQPLLEGFGAAARADLDARSAEAEATRRTTDRRRTTTVAEVDAAYWILAEAEESERVARNSLERARTIHGRNLALLKEGMIAEIEVLTAENGVAARKEALIAAMLSRIQSAENLLFLVEGEAAARVVALPRIATAVPAPSLPPDAAMLEAGALRARPDLAAAEADLRAAGIRLDAARNALLPDLDLTAAAGTGGRAGRFGAAWDGLSSNDEPSWSIGARLTFPIGNRADRASAEASAATRERKRLAQATLINEVRQGVRDAHRTVVLGIARLEAAGESRRLAEARLAAEEKRLEFGLSDTLRLLDVEESASSAALAETRARFAVARAWASLKSAAPQLNETGQ